MLEAYHFHFINFVNLGSENLQKLLSNNFLNNRI